MQLQPRRKYRFKWFRVAFMVVAGYCLYVVVNQQLELNAINREAEATRTKLEQLSQLNTSYVAEKKKLSTTQYVEKLARDELGMAKPGEVPYVPSEK
jgi:cell division protein FtsL